jgi:acetyl-CoA C-acetyltransferase
MDHRARNGMKYGGGKIIDGIIHDGLWDVYNNFHMGNCAEDCSKKYNISREEQDAYAIQSYKRSAAAWEAGVFKNEIVPVTVSLGKGKTTVIEKDDEYVKVDFTKVPSLKPAFLQDGTGTVTAANSSTLNDGASTVIVVDKDVAKAKGLKPLARIVAFADAATNPIEFTTAPALAIPIALKRAGLKVEDIDYWEINEAFAVVALANRQLLGLDNDKLNVNGGGVSLGHPIGASGARIVTSLIHQLHRSGKRYGVAAICNGGGAASAIVLERL